MKFASRAVTRLTTTSIAVVLGTVLVLSGCSGAGAGNGSFAQEIVPRNTVIDKFGTITATRGPNGEAPTKATDLALTDDQISQLKSGNHRVAILWHELSAWSKAIQDGMVNEFQTLGIKITATGDAKFDAATQANQIQSALATKPEVILGQAVDPSTGAAAYQPAVDAGVKLIFADQAPDGYVYGKQYQAILTDDLYQVGTHTGEAMCKAIGNKGEVAILYYDADFHVTNFRDASFQQTLHDACPDAKVVAKEGFSDPNKAEEIANGIIAKHPHLAGIYTSWAVPAQGVLAALKSAGNTSTKIVTVDLDDTIATDMVSPGGHTAAIIVDSAYKYGKAMAIAAALSILGKPGPEYGVSDVVTTTKSNVAEGYAAWNQTVPSSVSDAKKP
ncbi:MAG: Monosaccharide transporter substrate-binding protein family [Microbacteriaceae bacterium]|jgi:ribose transport system substrate-binding protein|nr:Monosaccharide transporter substrate-binding protein family [Microbacteriaceae bacterium]